MRKSFSTLHIWASPGGSMGRQPYHFISFFMLGLCFFFVLQSYSHQHFVGIGFCVWGTQKVIHPTTFSQLTLLKNSEPIAITFQADSLLVALLFFVLTRCDFDSGTSLTSLLGNVVCGLRFVLRARYCFIFLFCLSLFGKKLDKMVGQAKVAEKQLR